MLIYTDISYWEMNMCKCARGWTGRWLYAGKWVTSDKFEIWNRGWGWRQCPLCPRKQSTGPALCLRCPRLWIDFVQLFKLPSVAWDNWKCQYMMDRVIPRGSLHSPAGCFFFKTEWNWAIIMVLTGRLWVTQIVYRDRDWQKQKNKKNLPRSQMLKGWPRLEIQIWK